MTRDREAREASTASLAMQADASRRLVLKPRLADLAYAAKDDPHAPCYSWAEAWDEIGAEDEDVSDDGEDPKRNWDGWRDADDDDSSIGEGWVGGELGSDSGSDSESS